jgi:hypothetical protein
MKVIKIFYSWQEDINPKINKYYLKDCIEKAIKEINKNNKFNISLDRDTYRVSGSPDIIDEILKKISNSDIFIADISIINKNKFKVFKQRKMTPNPNVLFELGFAVSKLGWNRIICLTNLEFGKIENLPFDIRKNRVTKFKNSAKNHSSPNSKNQSKSQLIETLKSAINSILDNYDGIKKAHEKDSLLDYDRVVFERFQSLVGDRNLHDWLKKLSDSTYYEDFELAEKIKYFSENPDNFFINEKIRLSFKTFCEILGEFNLYLVKNLVEVDFNRRRFDLPLREKWKRGDYDKVMSERSKKIVELNKICIMRYKEFRVLIQNNLFI